MAHVCVTCRARNPPKGHEECGKCWRTSRPLTVERLQELLELSPEQMEVLTDLDGDHRGVIRMLNEKKRGLLLRNRKLVWEVSPLRPGEIYCCDLPDMCSCPVRTWHPCPLTGKGSVAEK